ncbi:MAG: ATP-binding protein [Steroidobacter sp.]
MTQSASPDPDDDISLQALRSSLNLCEAQLAQAQREMSGLLYAISHDLRAPLRALTGFNQALQEHLGGSIDDTGKHYLHRLDQASQRMSSMIDAVLMLSRVMQTDLIPLDVDLAALSREAIAEIASRYPDHHPVVSIASPLQAHGDPRLLKQVLSKLLENAWKCTMHHADPRIEVGGGSDGGTTTCFVKDNGIGFDMALSSKLFVPFQQLHAGEALRGQGLGLAIAQRIIARHGGRIWAQSEPGHGAEFFFSLPSATRATHTT